MKIVEITGTPQIFGKYKRQVKRRFRCTTGPRKGRQVADPATCSAPINIKKRMDFRATRAKKKGIQGARAGYTKKYNPTSKIAKKLNVGVKKTRRASPVKSKRSSPVKISRKKR